MSNNTFIWVAISVAVALFIGGVVFWGDRGGEDNVSTVAGAKVSTNEQSHDWGKIPINDGNVTKQFNIANEGSEPLKLSNVNTSCMCTTAQLVRGSEKSPKFGMHGKSSYVMELMPGEQAQIEVVFDPAFHGSSGLGPITRQVVLNTSDPDHSRLQFSLRGIVVK